MLALSRHQKKPSALPLSSSCSSSRNSRLKTSNPCNHRNQKYSIIGLTNAAGTLVERYSYTAYGTLGIYDPSGTVRTNSTYANRYTYTGREYDADLNLYHFRARWYDTATGGFISRDPLGYVDGMSLYRGYFGVTGVDPNGKAGTCWMDGFEFYMIGGSGLNWRFRCTDDCGNSAHVIMARFGAGIGSAGDGGIAYMPEYQCIADIPSLSGSKRRREPPLPSPWSEGELNYTVPIKCFGVSEVEDGTKVGTVGVGGSYNIGKTWVRALSKTIISPCPRNCEPQQPVFPRETKPCFEGSTIGPFDPGHQCGIICSWLDPIGSPAWKDCMAECAEQYDKSGIPPFDDPYWEHR